MKRIALFLLFFSLLSFPLIASDDIEGLINKQKTEETVWKDSDGDLPPARLIGDKKAVLVYSPANETTHDNLMCTPVEFDEIVDLELDEPPLGDIVVNTKMERVRDSLADSCLVRPGDPFLAVGPDWQTLVVAKDFIVRREKPVCPNDPPYSLWMTFDGDLPEDPFFFTTEIDLPEAPNTFKFMDQYPTESVSADLKSALAGQISFLDEYETTVYLIKFVNSDRLIHLRKKSVSGDDAELPNEIILSEKDGEFQTLLSEPIDAVKGSGHVLLEGVLDFDGDKIMDLILRGDHRGCPYKALFKGKEIGFERMDLPFRPCAC